MTTLKQLLNCALYDERETKLGQICDALFDKKSGKCLLAVNGIVYGADKFKFNDDGVVAVNLRQTDNVYPSVVNKAVYDVTGKLLGKIDDGIVGRTTNVVKLILDNGKQYTRGRIAFVNDIVLIKTPKPAKKKTKRPTEQMQVCASEQTKPAKVVDTAAKADVTAKTEPTANSRAVRRRYGDFSFLLGKTADKNITNFFGEVMIHRGESVTPETLRQAKISGKLIELCLHVR